jgi:transcriptional regulator with XRE-family HTH domain
MNDLKQRLARAVRAARMRKGLTQETVAEQAGVTTETVSNTERAQSLVTLDVFLRLAAVLNIDLASVIDAQSPAHKKENPRRERLEGAASRLLAELSEVELELLIRIGRQLRRSRL